MLAIGNILGGIALQTVVLVYLDIFGLKKADPLTYRAASLVIVLEGLLVVAVLTLVMVGHQLSSALLFGWLPPVETIIAIVWVAGVYLIGKARTGLPWHEHGFAPPGGQREPRGHSKVKKHEAYKKAGVTTGRVAMRFVVSAMVTLVAGVALELSSGAIATTMTEGLADTAPDMVEATLKESLQSFFDKLTAEQKASIVAVGMDRAGAYLEVVKDQLPQAESSWLRRPSQNLAALSSRPLCCPFLSLVSTFLPGRCAPVWLSMERALRCADH